MTSPVDDHYLALLLGGQRARSTSVPMTTKSVFALNPVVGRRVNVPVLWLRSVFPCNHSPGYTTLDDRTMIIRRVVYGIVIRVSCLWDRAVNRISGTRRCCCSLGSRRTDETALFDVSSQRCFYSCLILDQRKKVKNNVEFFKKYSCSIRPSSSRNFIVISVWMVTTFFSSPTTEYFGVILNGQFTWNSQITIKSWQGLLKTRNAMSVD